MVFVQIREAKEGDCGNILRLIRVKSASQKPGSQRGSSLGLEGRRGCGGGGSCGRGLGGRGGKRWELGEEVRAGVGWVEAGGGGQGGREERARGSFSRSSGALPR